MTPDLHSSLLRWFDAHARDLPWRETGPDGQRDPYRVWISEVLLQQTQVVRGRVYFARFLAAFPDVQALAAAPTEAVLKAWEGCGYYARARNLHRAAKIVAEQGMPRTYDGWRALPGVGPYTAAAVTSIAFGEPRAVNDGNVRRVLARLFGEREPTEAWVQRRADEVLHAPDPGRWNEALMDLGATICTPRGPRCGECPLRHACAAFASGAPETYPAPKKRNAVREDVAVALLVGDAQHVYLEPRADHLFGGMRGVPMELANDGEAAALARLVERLDARDVRALGTVTHAMTHRRLTLHVYAARADRPLVSVHEAALPRLDHKVLALLEAAQPPLLSVAVTPASRD